MKHPSSAVFKYEVCLADTLIREYFSERAGRKQPGPISLELFRVAFSKIYGRFEREGYFQIAFGYDCVDAGYVAGEVGTAVEDDIRLRFGATREGLIPSAENISKASLDDLFDLVEYFFDHISKPGRHRYHDYNNCGIHVSEGSKELGQQEWCAEWNPMLSRLEPPHRLTTEGRLEHLPSSPGLRELVDSSRTYGDPENVDQRVKRACDMFLGRAATSETQRDALRELAAVLEFLRRDLKKWLPQGEESDLFNIANNYGIRHHNEKQKTSYNHEAFYPWIFHSYLAAIDLLRRLTESERGKT